jgi:hypothetical protein
MMVVYLAEAPIQFSHVSGLLSMRRAGRSET